MAARGEVHIGHYGRFGVMDWKHCGGGHGLVAKPPGPGSPAGCWRRAALRGGDKENGPLVPSVFLLPLQNVAAAQRGHEVSVFLLSACCKQCV